MPDQQELKPAVPRLDGIDTLRGLSILAVILLHIWIRFSFFGVKLAAHWPRPLSHLVFFNGGNGVTTFFAISGFLITFTSLRRFGSLRDLRPSVFYRIRFARIMPLLLLLLAVLSVLHLAHAQAFRINEKFFTLPRALLAALTFHLNWLEAARDKYLPACWTVLWSLSIEEMFYLFFPLISLGLFRAARVGRWLWIMLALAFFALGPFARVVWPKSGLQAENSYLAGMASIAIGCLTALIVDRLALRFIARAWLRVVQIAGWAGILLIAVWPTWHHVLRPLGRSGTDDALLALSVCLVIAAVTLRRRRGLRGTAPLRWFGRHSYELYLSHEFVVIAAAALFGRLFPHGASRAVIAAFVCATVLATAPLAWALARWFSEPMNRKLRGVRMANASREESLPALEPTR